MATTAKFLKLRAAESATIKTGQWHAGFSKMKKYAESKGIPLIAVWSNGDACGHCIMFEEVLMKKIFKTWQSSSGCAFWFGCSSDKTKDDKFEGTGFMWCYNNGAVKQYPMVRVYWKKGKIDKSYSGGKLTGDSNKDANATKLVKNLKSVLKGFTPTVEPTPAPEPTPEPDEGVTSPYVTRLNESLTTAQINQILDALDKNDGYCPCQTKGEGTKCHCEDYVKNKKIGEPCICKIYVKKSPVK